MIRFLFLSFRSGGGHGAGFERGARLRAAAQGTEWAAREADGEVQLQGSDSIDIIFIPEPGPEPGLSHVASF